MEQEIYYCFFGADAKQLEKVKTVLHAEHEARACALTHPVNFPLSAELPTYADVQKAYWKYLYGSEILKNLREAAIGQPDEPDNSFSMRIHDTAALCDVARDLTDKGLAIREIADSDDMLAIICALPDWVPGDKFVLLVSASEDYVGETLFVAEFTGSGWRIENTTLLDVASAWSKEKLAKQK